GPPLVQPAPVLGIRRGVGRLRQQGPITDNGAAGIEQGGGGQCGIGHGAGRCRAQGNGAGGSPPPPLLPPARPPAATGPRYLPVIPKTVRIADTNRSITPSTSVVLKPITNGSSVSA